MNWILLLLGCSSPTTPEPEAVEPPTPPSQPTMVERVNEARGRLSTNPPPLSELSKSYVALAERLEVGSVRCPAMGSGRVRRVYGTARDRLDLGISYRIAQPEDPVPWSSYFDEVPIEDGWVVFLAEPGSTSGYLRFHKTLLRMTWPEAKAGETTTCTGLEAVPVRPVIGRLETPEDGVVDGTCAEQTRIAKDGTFFLEAQPPCSLWLLTKGQRSATIKIADDASTKLDLDIVPMAPDTLQASDGALTSEGRKRVEDLIALLEEDITKRVALIEELQQSNAASEVALGFWRGGVNTSQLDAKRLRSSLLPSR